MRGLSRRRRWGVGLLVLLTSSACTRAQPGPGVVTHRSPQLPFALQSSFAVAPVGHADPVEEAAEISAFLTNQLFVTLLATAEGVDLVGPQEVLNQLSLHDEEGFSHFRRFRLGLVLGQPLEPESCVTMSRLLRQRYVLFSWVEEDEQRGLEDLDRDYTEKIPDDVRRATYSVLRGTLQGRLVDLWEADLLWSGHADYRSERIFSHSQSAREELQRARRQGVLDFVRIFRAG